MWVNKQQTRQERQDWILTGRGRDCTARCPSDGHSVRLEESGGYDEEVLAWARVRLLHDAYKVRDAITKARTSQGLWFAVSHYGAFAQSAIERDQDGHTVYQGTRMLGLLASGITRKVQQALDSVFALAGYYDYDQLGRPRPVHGALSQESNSYVTTTEEY